MQRCVLVGEVSPGHSSLSSLERSSQGIEVASREIELLLNSAAEVSRDRKVTPRLHSAVLSE